jgi:hypothetical protein
MSVPETGEVPGCGPREQLTSDVISGSRRSKGRWASRWLFIALILASFFSMGRLVGAFQKEQEILRAKAIVAEKFEIRGEDKTLRAALVKGPDGGGFLVFFDSAGNARLSLGMDAKSNSIISFFGADKSRKMSLGLIDGDGAPSIQLFDAQGESTLSVGLVKGFGPSVTIGKKGKGQISMSVVDRLSSSILISDSKAHPRIALSASDTGPSILLLGDIDAVRASWRVLPDGVVSFSLRDGQSRERLIMMTDKDGKPSIKFLSPDGKVSKAL